MIDFRRKLALLFAVCAAIVIGAILQGGLFIPAVDAYVSRQRSRAERLQACEGARDRADQAAALAAEKDKLLAIREGELLRLQAELETAKAKIGLHNKTPPRQ